MKVQFEAIQIKEESSFRILQTPHLQDFFLWHSHPEYELLYVEANQGPRRVGGHASQYEKNDLVFIGPHVPHLNFDYGVKGPYSKIVVQMKEDFLGKTWAEVPELKEIKALFALAKNGVRFEGNRKEEMGQRLMALPNLSHFNQFIEILSIFQVLAHDMKIIHLNDLATWENPSLRDQHRWSRVRSLVENHYMGPLSLQEVAEQCHLSKEAFCRYFKSKTQLTFTNYVNQYRITQAKKMLFEDRSIGDIAFACGFDSMAYFTKIFKRLIGESPVQYRKRMKAVNN
ncbi:AraC family transcriptional regulator [Aquirufa rosea]|uniref:AraC family transcriptional regulator n=1 Tax=Aquirufa rosea TaxID=2509241 RepID=A0A4Q1C0B9_9BACT|nr:AraC family transcriptional regulator [Aquirufa rosea]RXK49860.1 AraC family transcriptional regulator [Aquirufa rosea]